MKEQPSIFEYPRWTILLDKKEADEFEETEFKVISRQDNLFNENYAILEIESLTFGDEYTAEDVLSSTGALAVHEEFTNAIVTTPDSLDDIADDMYCWQGAGVVFLGDMLTDIERLNFLMKKLYEETKTLVTVDKIELRLTKDGDTVPLADNVESLFTNDCYSVIFEGKETTLWWASIIEDRGLFLVVIDEDYEDDEEEEVKKLLPAPKYTDPYSEYWDDIYGYDGYDYDDRYYQRT